MAFNKAVFQTRALTALIFVVVMLTGLLWKFPLFFLLFIIIAVGCWYEFVKIIALINRARIPGYIKVLLPVCGILLVITGAAGYFSLQFGVGGFTRVSRIIPLSWLLIPLLAFLLVRFCKMDNSRNKYLFLAGFAYLSVPFALLINLRLFDVAGNPLNIPVGKILVCGMVFSIWINDTMAYLVGSFFGRTPLSAISPKKTWEGTIGGMLLCILTISLAGYFIPVAKNVNWYHWVSVSAIAAIAGTFGDLLESRLKRSAGLKDSGSIMPGHGGFLDRFDSLILATPFVWMYVNLMM